MKIERKKKLTTVLRQKLILKKSTSISCLFVSTKGRASASFSIGRLIMREVSMYMTH